LFERHEPQSAAIDSVLAVTGELAGKIVIDWSKLLRR